MISRTIEYALRAVVYLAQKAPEPSTTEQIAKDMQVPPAYLYKVLQGLNKAGIVRSRRGNAGGVSLAREPVDLSLLDVVNAVDPIRRVGECPLGLKHQGGNLCPLHRRLDKAMAGIEEAFRQTNLAEMLAESGTGAHQPS